MPPNPQSDRLLLAIISGLPPDKAARAIGIPEDDIELAVAHARRRLTLAAEYNRDEKLGTAISRFEELYAQARNAKDDAGRPDPDFAACLKIQKELNRLMDLYRPSERLPEGDSAAQAELAAIRAHLLPLALAPDSASTEELARLAVIRCMSAAGKLNP